MTENNKTRDRAAELEITQAQLSKLHKFRSNVMDVLGEDDDDYYLVRWLKARHFHLKKAEDMLRESKVWRREIGADELLTSWKCPEVLQKYDVGGMCGFDKGGRPIWIYNVGNFDSKGFRYSVSKKDLLRHYAYKNEITVKLCKSQSNKYNRRIAKQTFIMDFEGVGIPDLLKPGMREILEAIGAMEMHYPESVYRCFVINTSGMFPIMFKIMRPFIPEESRKRLVILGSDYKDRVLEEIDPDQLPVHWGGSKVDEGTGDVYCSSVIGMGGKIPAEYYLKSKNMVDQSQILHMHLHSSERREIEHTVTDENISLRYTFWTKTYDIKFGIFIRKEGGKREQILTPVLYSTHIVPEDGLLRCQKLGTYIFDFDNTYSWIHGKDISYCISEEATIDEGAVANVSEDTYL